MNFKSVTHLVSMTLLIALSISFSVAYGQTARDRSLDVFSNVRVDAAPLSQDRYKMEAMRIGRDLVVYRLDTITGQTWTVNQTTLDRIKESGAIPEGNFDLEVVPVKGDREHWVVRMDRKTGRMWYASEGRWEAYGEKP